MILVFFCCTFVWKKKCFYEKLTFVWVHFLFIDCGCCHSNAFYPFAILATIIMKLWTTVWNVHNETYCAHVPNNVFFCFILLFLSLVGNIDRMVVVVAVVYSLFWWNIMTSKPNHVCFVVVTILTALNRSMYVLYVSGTNLNLFRLVDGIDFQF